MRLCQPPTPEVIMLTRDALAAGETVALVSRTPESYGPLLEELGIDQATAVWAQVADDPSVVETPQESGRLIVHYPFQTELPKTPVTFDLVVECDPARWIVLRARPGLSGRWDKAFCLGHHRHS